MDKSLEIKERLGPGGRLMVLHETGRKIGKTRIVSKKEKC